MAHFAEIDESNTVVRVLVVPDSQENRGQEYLADDLGLGGTWKKTSYNTQGGVHANGGTPYRKNYAGVGYTFDAAKDAFIAPKRLCRGCRKRRGRSRLGTVVSRVRLIDTGFGPASHARHRSVD